MAIRKIVKKEDPILYKRSREVLDFDRRVEILIEDMIATLEQANGVGLAAVQVGVLKRIIIVDIQGKLVEVVNPKIVKQEGLQKEIEGCLSFPGEYGITKRPETVIVEGFNKFGKTVKYSASGLIAREFCHEIDHLDGITFKDRAIRLLTKEDLENS